MMHDSLTRFLKECPSMNWGFKHKDGKDGKDGKDDSCIQPLAWLPHAADAEA